MGLDEGGRGAKRCWRHSSRESPSRPFEIPSGGGGGDFLSPTILRKRPVGYVQIALSLVTWSTVLFSLCARHFSLRDCYETAEVTERVATRCFEKFHLGSIQKPNIPPPYYSLPSFQRNCAGIKDISLLLEFRAINVERRKCLVLFLLYIYILQNIISERQQSVPARGRGGNFHSQRAISIDEK